MAEQNNSRFNPNHSVDLKVFRLDIYRLACYLEASKPFAVMRPEDDEDELFYFEALEKEFFSDEISRILLQSAILMRVIDDESEAEPGERHSVFCGILEIDGKEEPLNMREACNKIIHTGKINFDSEETGEGASTLSVNIS